MQKIILVAILTFGLTIFLFSHNNDSALAATDNIGLSTSVQEYLVLNVASGGTVNFGTLMPGTPIPAPNGGSTISVTTNSSNGYSLAFSDLSDTNSILSQSGTYISDMIEGSTVITTPTAWVEDTHTGLGVTLLSGTTKDTGVWGTGATYDSLLNKYRSVPASANPMYSVTGYREEADTSTWAFKLDVPNDQKTGSYSGNLVITATGVWL